MVRKCLTEVILNEVREWAMQVCVQSILDRGNSKCKDLGVAACTWLKWSECENEPEGAECKRRPGDGVEGDPDGTTWWPL